MYRPLVSVIVPMYNVSRHLHKCVQSLMNQTLTDFEILFIDDCSTDDSLFMLKECINRYSRERKDVNVNIISNDSNKGVAASRNTGLINAKGDFIYFVDADDWIEKDAIKILYNEAINNGFDMVGCECYLTFNLNQRHLLQPDVSSGNDAFKKMAAGILKWNLWLYLVRRDLFVDNHILFIDGENMGEDMMVVGKLLLCAKKINILHKPFYHYIQTNTSSMTNEFSLKHKSQVTANLVSLEAFVNEFNDKEKLTDINLLKLNLKLPLLISDDTVKYDLWNEWFKEANNYIFVNPFLSMRTKIIQWLAYKKQYFLLKLYYVLIFKFVYGVLYK